MTNSQWQMVIWFSLGMSLIANAFMMWDGFILSDLRTRVEILEATK
jgi:hypothetical protein